MKKILITGSRDCPSKETMFCLFEAHIPKGNYIIQGGANGVDKHCLEWCNQHPEFTEGWTTIYPVNKLKKDYYLHRNAEMIGMCDEVIAFWNGKSRGTKFTIDYAKARNKHVKVIQI